MPQEPEQTGPFTRNGYFPWIIDRNGKSYVEIKDDSDPEYLDHANAIAEALNIHARTKQTPSGLLEQRDRLAREKEKLEEALRSITGLEGWIADDVMRRLFMKQVWGALDYLQESAFFANNPEEALTLAKEGGQA